MSTYKVIQDIEAEDKLIGPFSFRQFLYLIVAAFMGFLNYISIAKGAAFMTIVFAPPMLFCLFFAWPWSPDQPTEVWALARIRFFFKPRKRIWDQAGIKEFVTITVPKKIERVYTDGLSQTEVRSRLSALASTIDSRGWAVKNATLNEATRPIDTSDRLVNYGSMPQAVSDIDIRADDDILDEANNPFASRMNDMIDASTKARHQQLMDRLSGTPSQTPPTPSQQWFTQPAVQNPLAAMVTDPNEPEPMTIPAARPAATNHLKMIDPAGSTTAADVAPPASATTEPAAMQMTAPAATAPAPNPAILNLAHDNNLDVATLAREAKRVSQQDQSDGEVVVSLR